jgi:uncharacterized cupredoxin-like copper-binding protein
MKKSLLVFMFVIALSTFLTACDGSGPTTNIEVSMVEFTFTPSEFTVPAGKEITITAANNGAVEHEFVIFKPGTDAGDKFGDEDMANIYWQIKVLPGGSTTTTFIAPSEPGKYYVTCGTAGHMEAGMSGSLTVVSE